MNFEMFDYLMDWVEVIPELFDFEDSKEYFDYLQAIELA